MDSKNLKINTKTYKWHKDNKYYTIEARTREDRKYQLFCTVANHITKETNAVIRTEWQELGKNVDPAILGIRDYSENKRKINKIFFDLYIQFPNDDAINMINKPLFARFYTKHHYTSSDGHDQDLMNFDYSDEIWLSCDNNMNINISKFYVDVGEDTELIEQYHLENYPGDDQFTDLRRMCESEDKIEAKIYKWVLKKVKTFYNDTFGKRIDETIQIFPRVLLNLVLNYLI